MNSVTKGLIQGQKREVHASHAWPAMSGPRWGCDVALRFVNLLLRRHRLILVLKDRMRACVPLTRERKRILYPTGTIQGPNGTKGWQKAVTFVRARNFVQYRTIQRDGKGRWSLCLIDGTRFVVRVYIWTRFSGTICSLTFEPADILTLYRLERSLCSRNERRSRNKM